MCQLIFHFSYPVFNATSYISEVPRGRIVCFFMAWEKNTGTGSKSSPAAILGLLSAERLSAQNGGHGNWWLSSRCLVSGFFLGFEEGFILQIIWNFVASSKTNKNVDFKYSFRGSIRKHTHFLVAGVIHAKAFKQKYVTQICWKLI